MSVARFDRRTPATTMMDGRRRAWRTGPGRFKVYGRAGDPHQVDVDRGVPHCHCPAGTYGQPCWHAALVLARLQREERRRAGQRRADLVAMERLHRSAVRMQAEIQRARPAVTRLAGAGYPGSFAVEDVCADQGPLHGLVEELTRMREARGDIGTWLQLFFDSCNADGERVAEQLADEPDLYSAYLARVRATDTHARLAG